MNDGHLYFGWPAQEIAKSPQARRFISVKMRTVFPHAYHGPQTELPKDLTAEDLATIGMLYMIETGGLRPTSIVMLVMPRPRSQ